MCSVADAKFFFFLNNRMEFWLRECGVIFLFVCRSRRLQSKLFSLYNHYKCIIAGSSSLWVEQKKKNNFFFVLFHLLNKVACMSEKETWKWSYYIRKRIKKKQRKMKMSMLVSTCIKCIYKKNKKQMLRNIHKIQIHYSDTVTETRMNNNNTTKKKWTKKKIKWKKFELHI